MSKQKQKWQSQKCQQVSGEHTNPLTTQTGEAPSASGFFVRVEQKLQLHSINEQTDQRKSSPYKNLIAAILERALLDLASPRQTDRRSAKGWLFSPNTKEWSFFWICQMLDIEGSAHALRTEAEKGLESERIRLIIEKLK